MDRYAGEYANEEPDWYPGDDADEHEEQPLPPGKKQLRYAPRRMRNRLHSHLISHGLFARDFAHRRLFIRRRSRAAHVCFEWHNYKRTYYVSFGIHSPYHHRWWAANITFYFSHGRGRQPITDRLLGWIPATGYRSHDFMWLVPRKERARARRFRQIQREVRERQKAAR